MKNTFVVPIRSNFNTLPHDVLADILGYLSFDALRKMIFLSMKLYQAFQELNERENIFSRLSLKKQHEVAIKIIHYSEFMNENIEFPSVLYVRPIYFSRLFLSISLNPFALMRDNKICYLRRFSKLEEFVRDGSAPSQALAEIVKLSNDFLLAVKQSEKKGLRYIPKGEFRSFLQGISLLAIFIVASSPVWIIFIALFFALKTSADIFFKNTRIPCVDANWTDFDNAAKAVSAACDDLSHRCNLLYGNMMSKNVSDDIMVQCHLSSSEAAFAGWPVTIVFLAALSVIGFTIAVLYFSTAFFQRHLKIFKNLRSVDGIFVHSKAEIEGNQKTLSLFFSNAAKRASDMMEEGRVNFVPATPEI